MNSIPYPDYARAVKLSNPQHPFTPAHDVKVVIGEFAEHTDGGNILEIGCNLGWTTRELALAFPNSIVYAVDWPPAGQSMSAHQRGEAPSWEKSCEAARALPNVLPIIADSRKLTPGMFREVTRVFIDGDHSYEGVKRDTALAMRMMAEYEDARWVVTWHDCYEKAPDWVGVRKYLESDPEGPRPLQVLDSWVATLRS
jgi:precorrin-6B methylase 2